MRIGYFIPGWPPGAVPNGVVTTFGNLGQQLRAMGHDVFYVTPYSETETRDCNVFVMKPTNLSIREKLNFRWNFESTFYHVASNRIADAVQTLVREHHIEVLQMEETHGFARTVIRRVNIPVVVQMAGPWFINQNLSPTERAKPENRTRAAREGEAIRNAAALRAPSNSVLSIVENFYGPLNKPVLVVPNPIATKPKGRRWNLQTCDPNLILFVGRFDYLKGADLLLRAFAKLVTDCPNVRLCFVGPDSGLMSEDGHCVNFAEFVDRTIPTISRDRIEFLGSVPHSEIERLRTKAYMTIVPSRYETFGNTVIEAMAAGCPIIATNVGGIAEIIVHDSNGLMVPAEDINGLTTAMSRLLHNPPLAARLANQAVRDCEDWFEPAKIAQQYIDFYTSVIGRYKRSGV